MSLMDLTAAAEWFCSELEQHDSWAAGKLGTSEFNALYWFLQQRSSGQPNPYPAQTKHDMFVNAGLWAPPGRSQDAILDEWAKTTIEAIKQLDGIAIWNPMFQREEATLISRLNPTARHVPLRALEPFYTPAHQYTTKMTKGQVAVVSPFADSIQQQIPRLQEVFPQADQRPPGPMWLPSQSFRPIKAHYGPNITSKETWPPAILATGPTAAVQYLADQVTSIKTTRYALVGIGALSLPLVAELKRRGIVAVHTGGGTQIMFGIKGRRWDNHSTISKFYNDAWIRPEAAEIPTEAAKVERGCYW